jgi:hypothetical protein
MTAIQNIHTPSFRFSASVVRKAAYAALALTGTALVVLAVATSNPGDAFGAVIDWTASMYGFVLAGAIVGIAALGIRENSNESRKTQYDIR